MTSQSGAMHPAVARVDVQIVAAFTADGGGGNLAGVVLDAAGLDRVTRQRIAARVALSETAFVEQREGRVYDVEFYTPTDHVPDCGHATVATFRLLADRDGREPMHKRLITGTTRGLTFDGDLVVMEQARPSFSPFADRARLAAALRVTPETVRDAVVADNGVRFVLVEVPDAATLQRIAPDFDAAAAHATAVDAYGYYVYVRDPRRGVAATVRMFAPRIGIPEEPATGMAGGMLGALLGGDSASELRIEQGALSPNPSRSEIVVRPRASGVAVGGRATVRETRHIPLE